MAHIGSQGRTPVLEVSGAHSRAAAMYRRLGWRVVGHLRPAWLPEEETDVELMVLPDSG